MLESFCLVKNLAMENPMEKTLMRGKRVQK
jgi:hypothetical protein